MSSENTKRIIRIEEKLDNHINNDFQHLKEKVASIDGKLWVVLLFLGGIVLSTIFGK